MKTSIMAGVILVGMAPLVQASQIEACVADKEAVLCQSYLEGVVDGALMYKPQAVGARLDSNGYEARALKYRGGKRFQEANRKYCLERIPDRDQLVMGISEAFESGEVKDIETLQLAVNNLLDCQRLK
ncbi:hypothetical protein [Shewanella chilikensis]|uniref:hypothetical protein n=1 Tax=Shewanella chilikensis TaxID=558541 RepID=UPI0030076FFF